MTRFRFLSIPLLVLCVSLPALGEGYRTVIKDAGRELPLCVVKGTPYEMGKAFGQLFRAESQGLIQRIVGAAQMAGGDEYSDEALDSRLGRHLPACQ